MMPDAPVSASRHGRMKWIILKSSKFLIMLQRLVANTAKLYWTDELRKGDKGLAATVSYKGIRSSRCHEVAYKRWKFGSGGSARFLQRRSWRYVSNKLNIT